MNRCEVGHNLDISNFSLPAHFEYFAFYSPIRKPIQMGPVLESDIRARHIPIFWVEIYRDIVM